MLTFSFFCDVVNELSNTVIVSVKSLVSSLFNVVLLCTKKIIYCQYVFLRVSYMEKKNSSLDFSTISLQMPILEKLAWSGHLVYLKI